MTENISLGKKGKAGNIDFSKIKSGIKKEDLVKNDAKLGSIFDSVDKDGNKILDRNELQKLQEKIIELAGDDTQLSKREAKQFTDKEGNKIGRKNRDALFEFLNKLSGANKDVKSVEIKDVNGRDVEVITYNDGHTEELYPDGTKITMIKNGNKTVTTKEDKEGNTLSKVETTFEDGVETIIEYEGEMLKSKTVKDTKNNTISTYSFNGEEPVLIQEENTETGDITTYKDGVTITTSADGNTITTNDGTKTETRTLNPETGITTITTSLDGVETTLTQKDGKNLSQTVTQNGESYNVEYDGNGNTKGVIVQNGESPAAIAKNFGCSVKDLMEANKDILKGKKYFQVGAAIVIPGEIAADKFAGLNADRKTSEEARAEYAYDAQIRAERRATAAAREKAEMEALGIVNRNGAGTVINSETKETKDGKFKNFNKNNASIKKMTFTVVGETGNRERMIVKGNNGKYYTMAKDGIVLDEGYAIATKALDAGKATDRKDNHGRKTVTVDGKEYVFSQDGTLLKSDYVQASDIREAGGAKTTVSGSDVSFVKGQDGTIRYFDKNGNLITGTKLQQVIKAEAQKAAGLIYAAADGPGTDEEKLAQGINMIYSQEIMAEVNNILKTKDNDYRGDAETTPVEALLLDELSRSEVRQHIQMLAANGAYGTGKEKDTALGRNAAREIKYEVHGGVFGYTGTADLKEAMNLASTRGARLATEEHFQNGEVKGKANEGSMVRQYIAEDGWDEREVDLFDATWIKNNAYDSEHDQAHRNAVVGRLVFDYDSDEALHTGLEAVNDDPESADYKELTRRSMEANEANGYKAHFTNQEAVQIYLAGRTANDDGTVDSEHVSACNTLLFKGEKPARIQAEEILYNVQNGDMSNMFDSMDPKVYTAMADLIGQGNVKGCKSVKEAYDNVMQSTTDINEKTKIKANAILSGQIEFSDEEVADFCIELMHRIDSNRGAGSSTGHSAEYTNIADYETEQLKAILQIRPSVLATVKEKTQQDNFSFVTTITSSNGNGPSTVTTISTDTKADYLEILNNSRHIAEEAVFYDLEGKRITDPQQIKAITTANMNALNNMREYVAQLEREYKKGIDAEGAFSDAANWLSTYSGLGTDRADVATEYRNAKLLLNQLEAAAQGKLRDSEGKVISVQDLAQNIIDKENSLIQTNADYKSTIETAKMGMILAPVIVVTTVATAGTGAGFWASAGIAGVATAGTEYGLNTVERMTSVTGDTAEAREEHATSALIDGTSTFIGAGQMKFIPKILNNASAFVRGGGRLVTVAASDIGVGAAGEYVQTGAVSIEGTTMNAIFSVTGNLIGIKSLAQKHVETNIPNVEINEHLNGRDPIADAEIARNIDQQHLNANQRKIVEEGLKDIPTPEELAAYRKENGYQAPTPEERAALDEHQEQVAADYAEAHRIENNAVIKEAKAPTAAPKDAIDQLNDEIRGLDGQIRDINHRIAGAKRFGKDTSKLEAQLEGLQQKRAGKQAELETLQKSTARAERPVRSEETPDEIAVKSDEDIIFAAITDNTDILQSIKTLYPDITENELQEINRVVDVIKNGQDLKVLNVNNNMSLLNNIVEKINKSGMSYNTYKQTISNGKQITQMTDSELSNYYKKLVPYINDTELDCLIDQVHRIKNGEPRYLGTQQEKDILESIYTKQFYGLRLKGIAPNRGFKTSAEFPNAEIEFQNKNLTDQQRNSLKHWIQDGKNWCLEDIYDDLSIALKEDTYLYRGVSTRYDISYKQQANFLNTIKEGGIIDNSNKYISTAKDVGYASSYRNQTFCAGQSYMLKIKVPAGTKVLDMRLAKTTFDEIALQPHKLKVVSIDYNSGVVECEYIPAKSANETNTSTTNNSAAEAEPEVSTVIAARELTPEEHNTIGQIGNNINRAKTIEDLKKAQQWLDKMPECSQKTILQNQLDKKLNELKASTLNTVETVDVPEVEGEIMEASLLSPQEALMYDLQDKLGCTAKAAALLANNINAKPEIAAQLSQLALGSNRNWSELKELIAMATPDNIETLTKLSKNHNLQFVYDLDGNLTKNDFEIVMKIADLVPEYKADLIDIAASTQRPDTDIYQISQLMKLYPDKAHDIAVLTKSNANIKVGYDLNNQLSRNMDDIITYMDKYPQFHDEIVEYMSVQRRELNDTSDPTADLATHIETLELFPQAKQVICQLARNPNLDAMSIHSLLVEYGNNSQQLNDVIALSEKRYTGGTINRNISNFERYPELRSIMLSEPPKFTLIDKNVETQPIELLQKRFAIRQNLESIVGDELATLEKTLGDNFYPKVKWEEIIPENASVADIKNIVAQLNEDSKFFARTAGNERSYGKNIQWAHEMNNISNAATLRIREGDSFNDVIKGIALDYRAYDEAGTLASNTKVNARRKNSGLYRGYWNKQESIIVSTGLGNYPEYIDRFNAMANIKRTYNGIELTTIGPNPIRGVGLYMLHPMHQNIEPAMKLIKERYDSLQPLFQKVKNGGPLSASELKLADEQIAEMYFLMGNVMPWARGSNGISDIFMRSTYKALGINQPALKKGTSLDLEAFCMDIDEYKAKWNSFFEDGRTYTVADAPEAEIIGFSETDESLYDTRRTQPEVISADEYLNQMLVNDAIIANDFDPDTPVDDLLPFEEEFNDIF